MYINYYTTGGVIKTKEISSDYIPPIPPASITMKKETIITKARRILNPEAHYHTFEIPKRGGGRRTITAPNAALKEVQKEILNLLKEMKVLPHNAAHGFVEGRNCRTALEVHQKNKSRWFLKMDIHDFFGSITEDRTTRSLLRYAPTHYLLNHAVDFSDAIKKICFRDGVLPQGAPTSPILANIFMLATDTTLTRYCKAHENHLIYTRYADDILISSTVKFDPAPVIAAVRDALSYRDLNLSERKTRFGSFNGRNWNLGIMYNNTYTLSAGHKNIHNMKCAVHNLERTPQITDEQKQQLLGKLSYFEHVQPGRFTTLIERAKAVETITTIEDEPNFLNY